MEQEVFSPLTIKEKLFHALEMGISSFLVPDVSQRQAIPYATVYLEQDETYTGKIVLGNMEDPKQGFFLLGIQEEEGRNDRVFVCITPANQKDETPVAYFRGPLSRILSKIKNRTSYFWPIVKHEWETGTVQEQIDLKNPPKQLWDITKDRLPQDLQDAYEGGTLNIKHLIELAYEKGYQVYMSNQGSRMRGPLPIPGWAPTNS